MLCQATRIAGFTFGRHGRGRARALQALDKAGVLGLEVLHLGSQLFAMLIELHDRGSHLAALRLQRRARLLGGLQLRRQLGVLVLCRAQLGFQVVYERRQEGSRAAGLSRPDQRYGIFCSTLTELGLITAQRESFSGVGSAEQL